MMEEKLKLKAMPKLSRGFQPILTPLICIAEGPLPALTNGYTAP
jgi:hypothetical protein